MLALSINDELLNCPVCWAEVDTGTYQKLRSKNKLTLFDAFCVLIGRQYDNIDESQSELLESSMYQACSFVFNEKEYFRDIKHPTEITVSGVKVKIPTKLERLSIEQNLHIRSAMFDQNKCFEELISFVVCIYLQPLVYKSKFDFEKAKELEEEILKLPIEETFPIGFFYLSKLKNFGSIGLLYYLPLPLQKLLWKMKLLKGLKLKSSLHSLIFLLLIGLQLSMVNYQEKLLKNHSMNLCHSFIFGKNKMNTEVVTKKLVKNIQISHDELCF